jgi:hypothetical protein
MMKPNDTEIMGRKAGSLLILTMLFASASFPVSAVRSQQGAQGLRPVPDPYSRTTVRVDPGRRDAGHLTAPPEADGRRAGSVALHFRNGTSRLERDYMDNARMLAIIDRTFSDPATLDSMDYAIITAAASPDGNTATNERLAADRALSIKGYIMWRHPHVNRDLIATFSAGEDWDGLRRMIEQDRFVPYRDEALGVLSSPFTGEQMRQRLRGIADGATYRYLAENIFPYLRGGAACLLFFKREDVATVAAADCPAPAAEPSPAPESQPASDPVPTPASESRPTIVFAPVTVYIHPAKEAPARRPLFAVKTNLLLDAASALNAEIEVPLGRRWSLAGEWIFPWWLQQERQRALQLGVGTLEARRWLGDRASRPPMTGWFAGFYAGAGYYDVEWENKGYQGELFHAGLSAGYAHAISRGGKWRMEYSLGAGYVRTRYREYTPRFGADDEWHLIRRRSGNHTWIGPARAEISLVLMLGRKGGGR